jgi:copper chaperone CopZ
MDKTKKIFKVEGMDCASCATMIELDLEDAGIKATCSYAKGTLEVDGKADWKKIAEVVKKSGYNVK